MFDYIERRVIPESNRLLKITSSIPALHKLRDATLAVQEQIDRRLDRRRVDSGSDDFERRLDRIAVRVDNYFHVNPGQLGNIDLTRCTEMSARQFFEGKKRLVETAMNGLMGFETMIQSLDVLEGESLEVMAHLQDMMEKQPAMHPDVKKAARWAGNDAEALINTLKALVNGNPPILSDRTADRR